MFLIFRVAYGSYLKGILEEFWKENTIENIPKNTQENQVLKREILKRRFGRIEDSSFSSTLFSSYFIL